VEFSRKEEAQTAKESLNGKVFCGRPLVVRFVAEKTLVVNADGHTASERSSEREREQRKHEDAKKEQQLKTNGLESKIRAIQTKLAVMEKETNSSKALSSLKERRSAYRSRPY